MQTLTSVHNKAFMNGYVTNFNITKKGLCIAGEEKCYCPDDITIVNFYRFEGESDPGDNTILYILETTDGLKGTLADAYGLYADNEINLFMKRVENKGKK